MDKSLISLLALATLIISFLIYVDYDDKTNYFQVCHDIKNCTGTRMFTLLLKQGSTINVDNANQRPENDINHIVIYETDTDTFYRMPLLVKTSILINDCKMLGDVVPFLNCTGDHKNGPFNGISLVSTSNITHTYDEFNRALDNVDKNDTVLNARYTFYLARKYDIDNDFKNAAIWYKKRIELGGWVNEVYHARYRLGLANIQLDNNATEQFKFDLLNAYHTDPFRKEPLYFLARIARTEKNYPICLLYTRSALACKPSNDDLFIEKALYEWGIQEEHAICLYYSGHKKEARHYWKQILDVVPEKRKIQIIKNLEY